jgi:hypothetical protein
MFRGIPTGDIVQDRYFKFGQICPRIDCQVIRDRRKHDNGSEKKQTEDGKQDIECPSPQHGVSCVEGRNEGEHTTAPQLIYANTPETQFGNNSAQGYSALGNARLVAGDIQG